MTQDELQFAKWLWLGAGLAGWLLVSTWVWQGVCDIAEAIKKWWKK